MGAKIQAVVWFFFAAFFMISIFILICKLYPFQVPFFPGKTFGPPLGDKQNIDFVEMGEVRVKEQAFPANRFITGCLIKSISHWLGKLSHT